MSKNMKESFDPKKEAVQTELKPETFNSITSGINELRSKMVDQNPDEQEKILKVFERIFNAAYEK